MEIKYNVKVPPKQFFMGGAKSEEVTAIEDFLTSGNAKNMSFEYETVERAKSKISTVRNHRKKWNGRPGVKRYDSYRVEKTIYIVKV